MGWSGGRETSDYYGATAAGAGALWAISEGPNWRRSA
jgi:hypothetical protein